MQTRTLIGEKSRMQEEWEGESNKKIKKYGLKFGGNKKML